MMDAYGEVGGNLLAVEEIAAEMAHRYGIVGVGDEDGTHFTVTGMVEKPAPGTQPSNLMITGRYILQPQIFDLLASQQTGSGGEIQLTDAMIRLMDDQTFTGVRFEGRSYDCGDKIGFLSANLAFALAREDIAPDFMEVLRKLVADAGLADA
jgi:UTP--glucose-1-phosphate uridylyltransferase